MSVPPGGVPPAADVAQPWAHRLGHLLWETSARVSLLGEAELANTPLTMPALGLLDIIEALPGITVAEISRRLPTTQQSISQTVGRLEKLGYIERRLGPRRGVGLHVTEAGHQAHHQGRGREKALDQRLEDLLGAERHRDLCALLEEARTLLVNEDQRTVAGTTKVAETP
jgi:DNA-binding MarR family transcriptional regulator